MFKVAIVVLSTILKMKTRVLAIELLVLRYWSEGGFSIFS